MIAAEFYKKNGSFSGFRISGHAGLAAAGKDVACAAVSSAVQLTVNLLSVFGCEPEAYAVNNVVKCTVSANTGAAETIIGQLKLHFESIVEEFPKTIKITISEV